MTTVVCRMKPKAMTRAELRERIDLTENERNPKKSKHLETGKMRLCNQWLLGTPEEDAFRRDLTINSVRRSCIIYFTISKPFFAMICSSKPHGCRCTLLCSANYLLPMPLALSAPRAP
ncbi:hypothetical protein YC2023_104254 [Brassica napus]